MAKEKKNTFDAPLFAGLDLDDVHNVETVTEEAAQKHKVETVDFSDPGRPKTCLEVDFPILQVNEIAAIENNATKPIYMMSKWWARRRSAVFRQLLISAALKAPKDETQAAQVSWSQMYRKSHRKHGLFRNLKVVDIFMGGGTTVVEAARLGFEVTGIDLNPIAWWVVYNETHPVEPKKVEEFYKYIKARVKPQIMPFFTAKSPRGFDGKWIESAGLAPSSVEPIKLRPEDRQKYSWIGPEVIYTFWMKHIMCADPSCNHLTPQISSAIVAEKSAKIKCIENCVCPHCGDVFDFELNDFRMAPAARLILGADIAPFAFLEPGATESSCPHCKQRLDSEWVSSQQNKKGKPSSKEVNHYLLLPKAWLKGVAGKNKNYFGGYYGSSDQQDHRWFTERSENLSLIEVRGDVPAELEHSNFGKKAAQAGVEIVEETSSKLLVCGGCGRQQNPLSCIRIDGHLAPTFPYLIQGIDPEAKNRKYGYSGRFFALPDFEQIQNAIVEFRSRPDLNEWVPTNELWFGHQTHQRTNLPDHGYTHWHKMFNPRQLYVNSLLLKEISEAPPQIAENDVKSQVLGGWQNYLRHNCMFTIWNPQRDTPEPQFANNDYNPKSTTVENGIFSDLGRGNFASCTDSVMAGMQFAKEPYDLKKSDSADGAKSVKEMSGDTIVAKHVSLSCGSSTDLKRLLQSESVDLVVTDPPFGDNVNYSELADFFTVWLAKPLAKIFPDVFLSSESPKSLEAVANKARHPGNDEAGVRKADVMYDRLLTLCWKEAFRILKPGGLMAFTFHHDKDVAWLGVLESLFKAGFLIECAFPIRSDSTKGDGDFGSKKIEYDIVHVCRKRLEEPKEVFWATLRRRIVDSVKSRSLLLAQHKASGLHLADLEVIIRGEVLEQYSRHYGKVQKNLSGDLISVRDILLEANALAQSLLQSSQQDSIPDGVDPDTRVLLSLFGEGPEIEFGSAKKRLKGSGISLEELVSQDWVEIVKKGGNRVACLIPLSERWNSLSRKKTFKTDFDQVHFAVNCCLGDRQLDGKPADWEAWIEGNYKSLIPSVGPLLKFIGSNHFGSEYVQAIGIAYRTLERTIQRLKESNGEFKKASQQMSLFGD